MRSAGLIIVALVAGLLGGATPASAGKILFTRVIPPSQPMAGAHVMVMRSDGSGARRVPKHRLKGSIDLSPDGRRVAWIDGAGGLVTETFTGRNLRVVWPIRRANDGLSSPRWSPFSKQITVTRGVDPPAGWEKDQTGGFAQIFVLRADGRRRRRLSTPVHMASPNWSPDGRRIVAVGVRPRGPETCTGTPPVYLDVECTTPPVHFGLWVINVASRAAREIVGYDDGTRVGRGVWSLRGRTIAFDRSSPDDPEGQLWTVRPHGSGLHQLTNLQGGAQAPSWSPDGRRLAFTTQTRGGRSDVATMRADGSGLRILTHSATNVNPDWSR